MSQWGRCFHCRNVVPVEEDPAMIGGGGNKPRAIELADPIFDAFRYRALPHQTQEGNIV